MRISRREIKRNEAPALATGFHPSRSRFPEEAPRVFLPPPSLLRGGADRPPFHLSSPRFISIFLRAFCVQFHLASLLCHVLFLFPRLSLCHSRSRRARSSRFTTPLSPSPPRSFFPVLPSQFLPSLFLLVPSPFSHPFHDRRSVSLLRPAFSCLSVVSSLLPLLSARPPAAFPSAQPFPLSPLTLLPFTRSLFPSRLRRYFLAAPSLPRLYATLLPSHLFLSLSLSFPLFPFLFPSFFQPQRPRDNLIVSLTFFPIYIPPPLSLLLRLFILPHPIFIYLSFRSVSLPDCLSTSPPPSLASSFSAERLLRFSSVIDASPPRLFPDFSLSRPPSSRRRPTSSFSGKTQAETSVPLSHPCSPLHRPNAVPRFQPENWNLPGEFPLRSLLSHSHSPPLSFSLPLSLYLSSPLPMLTSFVASSRCG